MELHLYRKLERGGASDGKCGIAVNEGAALNAANNCVWVTKESIHCTSTRERPRQLCANDRL